MFISVQNMRVYLIKMISNCQATFSSEKFEKINRF